MGRQIYKKIGWIIGLSSALVIPLMMVMGVVAEREHYRNQAVSDVYTMWTNAQTINGPILAIPYEVSYQTKKFNKETERYENFTKTKIKTIYLIADELALIGDIHTQYRQRGIFKVPVYTSTMSLRGQFDTSGLNKIVKVEKGSVRRLEPTLNLAINDMRGLDASPTLTIDGRAFEFGAGSQIPNFEQGIHTTMFPLEQVNQFTFELDLNLRGAQQFMIAPLAHDFSVNLGANWPHPKFNGGFLPAEHTISEEGFQASWQTSIFSTDAQTKLEQCINGDCLALRSLEFGVEFIEPVDIYDKVLRSVKYGILFIGLTFITFFLAELLTATQFHPVQYALVGCALAIFYLLLISLSEHMSFVVAYSIATSASTLLIVVYIAGALSSWALGTFYGCFITALYFILFQILKSEDFALLMGSMLLFVLLSIVMLVTRRINWYKTTVSS